MPLEIGEVINGGAAWLSGSPLISKVLRNPVFTALLITVLSLIIIFALFKADIKSKGWRPLIKTGFWLTLVVTLVIFVHYYIVERHLSDQYAQRGVRDVVASIHGSAELGGGYQILDNGVSPPREPDPHYQVNEPDIRGEEYERSNNLTVAGPDELGLQEVVISSALE